MNTGERFWENTPLQALKHDQWEALCDGCARCCVIKLEDADSGELHFTRAACKLLDLDTGRCSDYSNRCTRVPDCLELGPDRLELLQWMPATCAYKRLATGRRLFDWHPLISGRADGALAAGVSVIGQVVSELDIHPDALDEQVFDWDV